MYSVLLTEKDCVYPGDCKCDECISFLNKQNCKVNLSLKFETCIVNVHVYKQVGSLLLSLLCWCIASYLGTLLPSVDRWNSVT